MELIAFVGPSLGKPDAAATRRIDFRPPAQCGDITKALASRPDIIGLIDGVFETAPAIWHKEIVYALSLGVVIFGAASMGALRAVELQPFGMIGIGKVFHAYHTGELEDDDEVAIQHGPAEVGYLPLTEAMVNIRAALQAAVMASVLTAADAQTLSAVAKSLFYKYRTWDRVCSDGAVAGVSNAALEIFRRWLALNAIDIKQQDAQELIDVMLGYCSQGLARQVTPSLNRTIYWASHEERFVAGESKRDRTKKGSQPGVLIAVRRTGDA